MLFPWCFAGSIIKQMKAVYLNVRHGGGMKKETP